jgi:hypothetical protein
MRAGLSKIQQQSFHHKKMKIMCQTTKNIANVKRTKDNRRIKRTIKRTLTMSEGKSKKEDDGPEVYPDPENGIVSQSQGINRETTRVELVEAEKNEPEEAKEDAEPAIEEEEEDEEAPQNQVSSERRSALPPPSTSTGRRSTGGTTPGAERIGGGPEDDDPTVFPPEIPNPPDPDPPIIPLAYVVNDWWSRNCKRALSIGGALVVIVVIVGVVVGVTVGGDSGGGPAPAVGDTGGNGGNGGAGADAAPLTKCESDSECPDGPCASDEYSQFASKVCC